MKSGGMIICAVIVLLLLPAVIGAINDFQQADQTDEFTVATGDTTQSSVTLSQDLYDDATRNASLSSNLTSDTPIASTYTTATNALLVTGLTGNSTRRLTVEYGIDNLGDYTGASIAIKVWPMLLVLGSICLIVAAVVVASKRGD